MHYHLEKPFDVWGGIIVRNRRRVLLCAFFLFLIATPLALKTLANLDADIFNQVNSNLPRSKYMQEISSDFGGDRLAVVISIPDKLAQDPALVDELRSFGDIMTAELKKAGTSAEDHSLLNESGSPQAWLQQVEVRAGEGLRKALESLAKSNPQAVLSLKDVESIRSRFTSEALTKRLTEFIEEYKGTTEDDERIRLKSDPIGLINLGKEALDRRQNKSQLSNMGGSKGYLLSKDKTTLLVQARPVRSPRNFVFDDALIIACQRAENRAVTTFRNLTPTPQLSTAIKGPAYGELADDESSPQISVGFTGLHIIAAENKISLRKDALITTGTSAIAILLLFLWVFHSIRLAVDIGFTICLAIIVTLAFAALIHGNIGVMGIGFTCILLGMGVDYGIHLYSTFHALRDESKMAIEPALRRTLRTCGPGIVAASLTTTIAFLGMATTDFRGLAELGLLSGFGLFSAALLMLSVFPALLIRPSKKEGMKVTAVIRKSTVILGKFHRKRSRNWVGIAIGALVLAVGLLIIFAGPRPVPESILGVRFDSEFSNLRSTRLKAIPLRDRIQNRFGQGFTEIKVLISSPDEQSAFAAAQETINRATPWTDSNAIRPAGCILDLLPPPSRQEKIIAALRSLDLRACKERFLLAARAKFGGRTEKAFKSFLSFLDTFITSVQEARPLTIKKVLSGELAPLFSIYAHLKNMDVPDIKEDKDTSDANRVRLIMNFSPKNLTFSKEWGNQIAQTLEQPHPGNASVKITSSRMMGLELKDSIVLDLEWITALVAFCVVALLLLTFRSIPKMLLALLPLLFGAVLVLTGVVISQILGTGLYLNFMNLMIFPILLGSGIDYGVYLISDAFSDRRPGLFELVSETGRGILLCGLTTLAGFGSMIGGSFTGLIDFGWVALFGYSGALLGALIVIPSVIGVFGVGHKDS